LRRWFLRRGKTGVPGEKTFDFEQGEKPTTNSTHIWHQAGLKLELEMILVGGERSPSLLPNAVNDFKKHLV